jgi:cytochrome c peroxidase
MNRMGSAIACVLGFVSAVGIVGLFAQPPSYVWQLPRGFPQPLVPADNPMTVEKVVLGRHLFYDTRLSLDGTFSCASCHKQEHAFADDKGRALGVTGQIHMRGSMSLANVVYSPVLTWANPTIRRLEAQALVPMYGEHPIELGLVERDGAMMGRLRGAARYRELFPAAFPAESDPFTLLNVTRAIASFERTLLSGDSPYDRYRTRLEFEAISPAAHRGEDLFFSDTARCFQCHGGFNFTTTVDYLGKALLPIEFHNTGLYNIDGKGAYPALDTGVQAISGDPADMGRFKPPSLRNIAVTAPYMHDGSIATLEGVVAHYEAGGRTIADGPNKGSGADSPLKSALVTGFRITAGDRADLVAFLESLTDRAFLADPRFSDPWPAHPLARLRATPEAQRPRH